MKRRNFLASLGAVAAVPTNGGVSALEKASDPLCVTVAGDPQYCIVEIPSCSLTFEDGIIVGIVESIGETHGQNKES